MSSGYLQCESPLMSESAEHGQIGGQLDRQVKTKKLLKIYSSTTFVISGSFPADQS